MRRLIITVFALAVTMLPGRVRAQDIISTFAGGGPNNLVATQANLNQPTSVAVDGNGNIYIASPEQHRIFKVDTSGTLTVMAGNGTPGSGNECTQGNSPTGCDLPIHTALHSPQAVAVDLSGNIFIADSQNNVIRVVNTQPSAITLATVQIQPGAIATVAGNGGSGFSGDGGLATQAKLARPFGVAVDGTGNIYIADIDNNRVREVDNATGNIKTVAGNGVPGFSGDGGLAVAASLNQPMSVALDNLNPPNLFIGDGGNHRVRKVDSNHVITTFAGNGIPGSGGDGGPATSASLGGRLGLALKSANDLFIADADSGKIREVSGGNINTVAGNGCFGYSLETSDCKMNASGGDGNPATSASLDGPLGVAVDGNGNFYIADTGNLRMRAVNTQGSAITLAGVTIQPTDIETLAGTGLTVSGDGFPGVDASLNSPQGMTTDGMGNVFIADTDDNLIRVIDTQAAPVSIGGVVIQPGTLMSVPPWTGPNGLNGPTSVAVDYSENYFIADASNQRVLKVDTSGTVTTVAGTTGKPGSSGDGNPASNAQLNFPSSVAIDASGNLYIADTDNHRIRAVNLQATAVTLFGVLIQPGYIDRVAGSGTAPTDPTTACAETGAARSAELNFPAGIWINSGNLYIADRADHCIRKVDSTGNISTVAGNGTQGYLGDGEASTSAELNLPSSIAVDGNGDLYIADFGNQAVRRVDFSTQIITTVAGNGVLGFSGDKGPAYLAMLANPSGVAFDATANSLLIADTFNGRIRQVTSPAAPAVSLSPPNLTFPNQVIATESQSQTVSIVNSGSSALSFTGFDISSDFGQTDTCPVAPATLAPGQNCSVQVIFKPSFAGAEPGTLTISDSAPDSPQTIRLSGTGVQSTAVLSSTSILFLDQTVGTTSVAQGLSITNNGSAPLTISSVTISGDFAETNNCGTLPATLAPGASCAFSVTFTPTAGGARNGSLTIIESADPNAPRIVNLTGYGIGPGISLSQSSISFSYPQEVGTTSSAYQLVLSSNGTSALTISSIATTGDFGETNNCPSSMPPSTTCVINVTFTPTAAGARSGTLVITDDVGSSPQIVALMGTGYTQPKAAISPTSLIFTSQLVGTSSSVQAVTLKSSGTAALAIGSIVASSGFSETDNCGTSLAVGATCTVNVVFSPTSTGTSTGTLTFSDNAADSPQTVYLTGTGIAPAVALSPASLSFGNQGVTTTSAPLGVALTSTGTAPLLISSIATTGDFAETNNCGSSVPPPTTCTISVTFTPTATGTRTGTLTITDSAANSPQTVALTGTGVGPAFSLSQTSLVFQNSQGVGTTSGVLPLALSSTSTAPLTINSVVMTGDFAQSNNCPAPPQLSTNCTINVAFTPTATGARSGTLTVMSNFAGTPPVIPLSGTGVPGYAMTVDRTSATVLKGTDSAVFSVSASSQFNFSAAISMSCGGNPAPACSFKPASITAGQSSVLTVSGLGPLQPGSLSFTVIGTSGSQNPSVALTIFIADYSISASSTTATVTAGQTAAYTLKIQPSGGFNQPVSLSCSGAPLAATCSVSPIAVTPDGTNAASATVTVTTTALSPAQMPGPFTTPWPRMPTSLLWLASFLMASAVLICTRLRRGRVRYLFAACALAILTWAACGGGGSQLPILQGTPSGNYTLIVSTTSGSLNHNVSLTLNVN